MKRVFYSIIATLFNLASKYLTLIQVASPLVLMKKSYLIDSTFFHQRFAPLRDIREIIFSFTFKQSIEILVFITKLSVRFAKTNGNH